MTKKKSTIITVAKDTDGVKCDGGGGALGHPEVWYDFNGQDRVTCLYCGQVFVKKGAKAA